MNADSPIRVFAATANQVIIWGLKALLESSARPMAWVGSHPFDGGLLTEIQRRKPDIVVADSALASMQPEVPVHLAERNIGLLILSQTPDLVEQEHLLRVGARGIVHAAEPVGTLLGAIEQVSQTRFWLPRELSDRMLSKAIGGPLAPKISLEEARIGQLTHRERDIIATLARHPEAKAFTLGTMLAISECTVRNHLSMIYRKLEVRGRAALVMFANRHHLA
ncbi:MAG: response regulator transcription factor [Betaproteobacteria bacterium]|nr:response regulator transcription factor [Betaproteobacteria bacterium]